MNADLHMAEDLKNTGKGNLFVIFGEPDIALLPEKDGKLRVKVNGQCTRSGKRQPPSWQRSSRLP